MSSYPEVSSLIATICVRELVPEIAKLLVRATFSYLQSVGYVTYQELLVGIRFLSVCFVCTLAYFLQWHTALHEYVAYTHASCHLFSTICALLQNTKLTNTTNQPSRQNARNVSCYLCHKHRSMCDAHDRQRCCRAYTSLDNFFLVFQP